MKRIAESPSNRGAGLSVDCHSVSRVEHGGPLRQERRCGLIVALFSAFIY